MNIISKKAREALQKYNHQVLYNDPEFEFCKLHQPVLMVALNFTKNAQISQKNIKAASYQGSEFLVN